MTFGDQLDISFCDEPRARATDPIESHEAAASAKDLQARHHRVILGALMQGAAGVDRIAAITRLTTYQCSKRMVELQRCGAIRLTGKSVKSTAGRDQREWAKS